MTSRVRARGGRTFRSLAQRNYRAYFAGHLCSVVGTWMQRIGQDWLILEITDSPLALGASLLCQFLPLLLAGAWGGVVVDRLDTRRLIIATQAVQGLLAVALAAVTLLGAATLPVIYGLAVGLGIVTVFDNPARQAFVAELVGPADIANAQALNAMVNNVGRFVGPAVAGVLILVAGVGVTFVLNAASFLAVLVALLLMDTGALIPAPPIARAPGQVRAGLRYVWERRTLRSTLLMVALVSVFGQNFRVVFPLLATDAFGGGAGVYGLLTAVLGLGSVIGGLAIAGAVRTTTRRLVLACLAFAATNVMLAVAPSLAFAIATVFVLGVTNIAFNAVARTLLQLHTASAMRGRVMAIYGLVFLGGIPLGGPLLGLLCELWGVRVGQAVAGGMCLAGALVLGFRVFRAHRAGEDVSWIQ